MYVADSRSSKAPAAPASATEPPGRRGAALRAVPGTVLALGAVSLVTDISSEMVTAVLPLYLLTGLGLSPLGFGLLDGIQNGFSALVRLAGGHLADRRAVTAPPATRPSRPSATACPRSANRCCCSSTPCR